MVRPCICARFVVLAIWTEKLLSNVKNGVERLAHAQLRSRGKQSIFQTFSRNAPFEISSFIGTLLLEILGSVVVIRQSQRLKYFMLR